MLPAAAQHASRRRYQHEPEPHWLDWLPLKRGTEGLIHNQQGKK